MLVLSAYLMRHLSSAEISARFEMYVAHITAGGYHSRALRAGGTITCASNAR